MATSAAWMRLGFVWLANDVDDSDETTLLAWPNGKMHIAHARLHSCAAFLAWNLAGGKRFQQPHTRLAGQTTTTTTTSGAAAKSNARIASRPRHFACECFSFERTTRNVVRVRLFGSLQRAIITSFMCDAQIRISPHSQFDPSAPWWRWATASDACPGSASAAVSIVARPARTAHPTGCRTWPHPGRPWWRCRRS